MDSQGRHRVLVVDDHPLVRLGVRTILEDSGDIFVAAEVGRAYEALDVLGNLAVDAVVLDVALPDLNGIEALRMIKQAHPRLPVLVLSVYDEELYAVRAMREGASGYLTKGSAMQELVTAIRRVVAGGHYVTSSLAERLASAVTAGADRPPHERLSLREFEVMRMIARGKSLRGIAETMNLSPKTITTYRSRVLEKMRMESNEELTRYTVANGLLE